MVKVRLDTQDLQKLDKESKMPENKPRGWGVIQIAVLQL